MSTSSSRVKYDPKVNKGLCSTCRYLQVTETEYGDQTVYCERQSMEIHKKLVACSTYEATKTASFDMDDAWLISVDPVNGEVQIGKRSVRFINGHYEELKYVDGSYEWVAVAKPKLKPTGPTLLTEDQVASIKENVN